jgi:hypothetical protein
MPTLAVVDDDPGTRAMLTMALQRSFRVLAFNSAKSLLAEPAKIATFNAFVLDWRLPNDDISGQNLIGLLRKVTRAPIFILTGDTSAGKSIAKAMDIEGVHHAAKPADPDILEKRLLAKIEAVKN